MGPTGRVNSRLAAPGHENPVATVLQEFTALRTTQINGLTRCVTAVLTACHGAANVHEVNGDPAVASMLSAVVESPLTCIVKGPALQAAASSPITRRDRHQLHLSSSSGG